MTPKRIAELRKVPYRKPSLDAPIVRSLLAECLDEIERLQTTAKRLRRLLISIKSFCSSHLARIGSVPPPGPYCNLEAVPEADSLRGLGSAVMAIEDKVREACDETSDIEHDTAWKK